VPVKAAEVVEVEAKVEKVVVEPTPVKNEPQPVQ